MPIDKGFGDEGKAPTCLVLWFNDEPFAYQCSRCGQPFLLSEDQNPKKRAAELRAAFKKHVQEEHPEAAETT